MKMCSCCKKEVEKLKQRNPPLCERCYKPPKEICSICDEFRGVHRRISGNPICINCYIKHFQPKYICAICGEERPSEKTNGNNHYCKKCYRKHLQPKKICHICGELDISYKTEKSISYCPKCYKSNIQPKEICSVCGEENIVNSRDKDGNPICPKCYKNPIEICCVCEELKEVWCRRGNEPYCMICNAKYKKENDEQIYLREIIRKRLSNVLNKYSDDGKIHHSEKYGIDFSAIIKYLGPCPGNRKDYHIDHIFPLSAFDLNNPEHIRIAFLPENHRWLKKEENLKKKDKYNKLEFEEYLKKYAKTKS